MECIVQRNEVVSAENQNLSTHLTHGDVGPPTLDKEAVILRLVEEFVEEYRPVLLTFHTIVGLDFDDEELGGVFGEELLHPVERLLKSHIDFGETVCESKDLPFGRGGGEGVD